MATWTISEEPDETCPACGAVYEVESRKLPLRDQDHFRCECGHLMRSWNDTRTWSYALKRQGERDA